MYLLCDTFNSRVISRHRTLQGASRAERIFKRAFKRFNPNSYIPINIYRAGPKGRYRSEYEARQPLTDADVAHLEKIERAS